MSLKLHLDLNAKTIKLLEENVYVNLFEYGSVNGFLDITLKAQATKQNIDKLDFIKIRMLPVQKNNIRDLKR